jgi:hypothetical protein
MFNLIGVKLRKRKFTYAYNAAFRNGGMLLSFGQNLVSLTPGCESAGKVFNGRWRNEEF